MNTLASAILLDICQNKYDLFFYHYEQHDATVRYEHGQENILVLRKDANLVWLH